MSKKKRNPRRGADPATRDRIAAPPDRRFLFAGALLILALAILAFFPALGAGFIWDDPDHILNNHTLRSLAGLGEIWFHPRSIPQWYPLTHTTFWLEYLWWGPNPAGYHATNILLHALSVIVLWRLLAKLEVPGAWLAAAVFAVHPIEVESVAWITERKNVLSLVFYLAAMHAYLFGVAGLGAPSAQIAGSRAPSISSSMSCRRAYPLALGLFLAALFSKTVTFSFPAAALLIVWWKRGRVRWADVVPLVPFFIAGIAMGFVTSWIEHHYVGADSATIAELRLTVAQRLMIAGRAIWFYAGKLLWPVNLIFIYPRWPSVERGERWNLLFGALLIALLAALFALRRRIGRGPLVGALLFCGTLVPALGFVNVYPMRFSFVADHFQYHASAALIALIVAGIWRFVGRVQPIVTAAAVLIPLLVLTNQRAAVYRDAVTLWRDAIAKNKSSWMIHTNLALALRQTGGPREIDEAGRLFLDALKLAPDLHDTHTNAGMEFGRRGDDERAIAEFQAALAINDHFAPAYYGWGQVLQRQGRLDEAMAKFERALEIQPAYPEANYRAAHILESRGQVEQAIEHYRRAIANNPGYAEARYDLASLLISRRQFEEAMANLVEVLRVQPENAQAWTNLGSAQLQSGHLEDARDSFARALQLRPGFPPAASGLAQTQRLLGGNK